MYAPEKKNLNPNYKTINRRRPLRFILRKIIIGVYMTKKLLSYLFIILMGVMLALNYHIFIVPNNFAPAGLNGIATMIQYKTGFSISYMSLLINIPLSTFAFFFVQKKFAVNTLLFCTVYSVSFLMLQKTGIDSIRYITDGHDTIYPVIISGIISGFIYGVCLKNNASTGGTDIISRYINKVRPETNFLIVTFSINAIVAFSSLFVYSNGGLDYKPAALCITNCFISTCMANYIIKGTKTAYKFTVITTHPDEISSEIASLLNHSSTKIEAIGTYTNNTKYVLICVVNKHQLNDFQNIISKYDDTFSFHEVINETYGNFVNAKKG